MTPKPPGNLDDILQALRLMPACIVREAAGGEEDIENFLWFPSNLVSFAERLVSIAGLAAMAVYTDSLVAPASAARRDQLIEDHLRTLLFDRGYSVGLACAIIQQCGTITRGPLGEVVRENRSLTGWITSRPENAGNLVRRQLHNPSEAQLANLVSNLRFLSNFSFSAEGPLPCAFRQKPLEIRPFLWWDGHDLWRFQRMTHENEERLHIDFLCTAGGEERRESEEVDFKLRARIAAVAGLLKVAPVGEPGTPADESLPQSFMPLFAESYPEMNQLAMRLFHKSTHNTRAKLWVRPLVSDEQRLHSLLRNEVYVTNAIIKQCLDRDPVSVLEDYFVEEPSEPERFFTYLVHDPKERRAKRERINTAAADYHNELFPFYCQVEHAAELRRQVERYRARLVAQKIVQLSGFEIRENIAQEDLNDYIRRAATFNTYLSSAADRPDLAKIREGLMACSRAAEAILRTLLLFYGALRWYDPNHPDSLDEMGTRGFNELKKGLDRAMLGTMIKRVEDLDEDAEVRKKLVNLLGRERMWPKKGGPKPIDALHDLEQWKAVGELKEWRNVQAHRRAGPVDKASALVTGFLEFLEWLQDARRQPGQSWPIFPVLLSLNLVSRNSCGISSVKYTLMIREHQHQITLYTKQPLSVTAGSFFGLPHLNKTIKDHLWVDPVLIPSGLFRVAAEEGTGDARAG